MALDVTFVPHDAFLEVLVTGTYDMQDAIESFPLVLAACRQTGLCKVLIDCCDLAGLPDSPLPRSRPSVRCNCLLEQGP
jgi:hypothetical protein